MAIAAVIVFASALVVGLLLTALVRRIAPRIDLVDRPDGRRKLHGKTTPFGGGAAVFLATTLVLAVLFAVPSPWRDSLNWNLADLMALFEASAVVVLVGVVDDLAHLRGRQKLMGQFLAASILIANGLVIEKIAVFGWQIDLGLLAIPFTFFWFLGAINSVNLLDGIDGLASMLGVILVATFAGLAAVVGRPEVAIVALAFAGALCGFMRYNFPPASIFLGDAGSMLIGLVVGALAIHGSLKGPGTVLLAAPLAVWTLPVLDSAAAILRRKLTGRSMYSTDRGHLHHRLMERLGSNRKVLALVAVCCAATSCAALASVAWKIDAIALVVGAAVVLVLAASGFFGRAEFALVWNRVRGVGRSLVSAPPGQHQAAMVESVRLQGSRQWENLWKMLTESAEKLRLRRIHLDVDLPMLHEGYTAAWESPDPQDDEMCWHMDIPLVVAHRAVGRLTVIGERNGEPAGVHLESLLEIVESLETELEAVVEDDPHSPPQDGPGRSHESGESRLPDETGAAKPTLGVGAKGSA